MSVVVGMVETFPEPSCDRAQALKVLEEAAEVFEAVDALERERLRGEGVVGRGVAVVVDDLVDECADVVTAVCNLLAGTDVDDLRPALLRCERRNRDRGRM